MGIIYISHFLEEVREISSRFVVLRDGSSVGTGITAQTSNKEIIRLMVGREIADLYPRSPHAPGEVVLDLKELADHDNRVRNVSLQLRRGQVTGIAGLIGAGRTELLRASSASIPSVRERSKSACLRDSPRRPIAGRRALV